MRLPILLTLFLFTHARGATPDPFIAKIIPTAEMAKGKVSFDAVVIENGKKLQYNEQRHCVMHSVFKFTVAIYVLHLIEQKKYSLDSTIFISKEEMTPNTWSPIRDKYPDGNIRIPVRELIRSMVSQSDNVACDVLLKHIGGPKMVNLFIHSMGIQNISIAASEADMAKAWKVQYNNWCAPEAMTSLLLKFYTGKILSEENTALLKKIMEETTTGPKRLKGQLPDGTIVAHKTGTGPTNKKGMTSATNDVGVITLPNGNHVAIAVFVNDAYAKDEVREEVIAVIAKAVYEELQH